MKQSLMQAIFLFWAVTSTVCLDIGNKDSKSSSLGRVFSKDGLQSWDDWMRKRSLSNYPWSIGELSRDKFQNWQDWMYKRRFGSPIGDNDFSSLDKSKFQKWIDWANKRNFAPGAQIPAFNDLDQGKFQEWHDWVSKRFNNMKPSNFEPSFGSGTRFQNWAEYAKRQNFLSPSSSFSMSGNPLFQSWQDWTKRLEADKSDASVADKEISKRQLGSNSNRYDSFRRYFTDGLQDWWSGFKGNKRDRNDKKNDNQSESN